MTRKASLLIILGVPLVSLAVVSGSGAGYSGDSTTVTFTRDVAPILYNNCAVCHRPGENAPMSLISYKEVRPWARSIRENVVWRVMPPWYADPNHGVFANDRRLSQKEIDTIVAWVDQGSKEGDPGDLPTPPEFPTGWQIGEPDLVLAIQPFKVPAEGVVPYQHFTVATDFTEDRWVRAAEIRPGERSVVHHVIITVQEPGATGRNLDGMLVGMAPGMPPMDLPPGHAKLIKAGSKLIFQMHYTPTGTPAVDRTEVGLIFSRDPVEKKVYTSGAFSRGLVIPPGHPNFEVRASFPFREDARILSFMPHMHLRGKDFEYRAVFPDGSSRVVLSVPGYNFNWQLSYVLETPLFMPKGSRLDCVAHFDNSTRNKFNPDPTQEVRWGQQTWEEMMIGWFDFVYDQHDLNRPNLTPEESDSDPDNF